MPRRRKIEIKASELECFDILVGELRTRKEFANFDPQSIHVWTYESYEQELKNVDKALYNLDRWLAVHHNETFQFGGFDLYFSSARHSLLDFLQ